LLTKSTKFAIFSKYYGFKSEQHSRFSPEVGQSGAKDRKEL